MNTNIIKNQGFTLIELTIVLLIIGLIIGSVQTFYRDTVNVSDFVKINAQLESIDQALVSFALKNNRLPCADTNGDGYEGNTSVTCGNGVSNHTGAVPYKTLGMNQMANTQTDLQKRNIIYGVYRNSNATLLNDSDLAVVQERTGDIVLESQYYQNNFDFIKALANANNATQSSNYIYTTGTATNENCGTIISENHAYILVSAGIEDTDNNGNVFDGVNANLNLNGTGTNCFSSPRKAKNNQYDDVVIVMNFQSLIGRLNTVN
ncbi:MAG: prepilin-type N-terminal cleavage/methylation domain-containing protein [Marinicellaceae bacterium]